MFAPRTLLLALVVALVTGGIGAPSAAAAREQTLEQLRAAAVGILPARARQHRASQPRRARITPSAPSLVVPSDVLALAVPPRSLIGALAFPTPSEPPAHRIVAARSRAPPR